MATHSSILAWKIPWTGQPGWLEPMELQSQTGLRLTDFRVVASSICAVYSQLLSHVWLFGTPRTLACQAPLSMEFSQARILEWFAILFSRGSSQPKYRTGLSCIVSRFFINWATREACQCYIGLDILLLLILWPGVSHLKFFESQSLNL